MAIEPSHTGRRNWKVRLASGFVAVVNLVWVAVTGTVAAVNLPADANEAWKAIVDAPEYVPGILAGLSLAILVWSLWPKKALEPVASPDASSLAPRLAASSLPSIDDIRDLLMENPGRHFHSDPIGDAFRRMANQPPPPPKFDMTFNQLVRRVAFESYWAADFNPDTPGTQWQKVFWWKPLKKEIFRALVGGDLQARGILNRKEEEADVGPTPIPTEFWRRADFHPELMLTEPSIDSAGNGERREIYTDIEVKSREVDALWRARNRKSIQRKPSPFVNWHKEWWAQQEEEILNHRLSRQKAAQ